ncbi:hypothetical protein QAD02_017441 [Eretmocerus hayati]|uniref:Uncharacterized protein n=1 Tax=Eretmocerus hayati TaxID=131215 RepID=A0ACC2PGE9_9HYME|nr:hypothetical protein QAD02_017441 [Eretmocerus hayati]
MAEMNSQVYQWHISSDEVRKAESGEKFASGLFKRCHHTWQLWLESQGGPDEPILLDLELLSSTKKSVQVNILYILCHGGRIVSQIKGKARFTHSTPTGDEESRLRELKPIESDFDRIYFKFNISSSRKSRCLDPAMNARNSEIIPHSSQHRDLANWNSQESKLTEKRSRRRASISLTRESCESDSNLNLEKRPCSNPIFNCDESISLDRQKLIEMLQSPREENGYNHNENLSVDTDFDEVKVEDIDLSPILNPHVHEPVLNEGTLMTQSSATHGSIALNRELLTKIYRDARFADITLITSSGRKYPAHRVILESRSKTFFDKMPKNDRKEIPIGDMADDVVIEGVLEYIYTDSVPNIGDNLVKFYEASKTFELVGLEELCMEIFKDFQLTIENVLDIFVLSAENNLTDLKERATVFLRQNINKIMETQKYEEIKDTHTAEMFELLESCIKNGPSNE